MSTAVTSSCPPPYDVQNHHDDVHGDHDTLPSPPPYKDDSTDSSISGYSSCDDICIIVNSSSDEDCGIINDIITVSDSDSAPTVDSTQSANSLKRPRSDDEVDVSKPKRSTFKTPLFDSESSDGDAATATQAPTATLTQSVPTVAVTEPEVDSTRKKKLRKCKRHVDEFNNLCNKAEDFEIDLNIQPFTSICELLKTLKLLSDSDDEGEDVHSDHDDDNNDDVDSDPNSDDERFINDGHISNVDSHSDGDLTDEEGINTRNIITGKRNRKAPSRYVDSKFADLLLLDVPENEIRHVFGSSTIHSD